MFAVYSHFGINITVKLSFFAIAIAMSCMLLLAGEDAVLPCESEVQEQVDEAPQVNSCTNLQRELDNVSDQLPPPGRKCLKSSKLPQALDI